MSRSLCFNTSTDQICLQVTPLEGAVLQTQTNPAITQQVNSIQAYIDQIEQQLQNPNTTPAQRRALLVELRNLASTIDRLEDLLIQ